MKTQLLVCPKCGSEDVIADASAAWSRVEQCYELICTHDNHTCQACGWEGNNPEWKEESAVVT